MSRALRDKYAAVPAKDWRWPMIASNLFLSEAPLPPLAVSDSEAARLLSVSVRTLYNWWQSNIGPAYCRVGTKLLYPVEGLQSWLRQSQTGGAST